MNSVAMVSAHSSSPMRFVPFAKQILSRGWSRLHQEAL